MEQVNFFDINSVVIIGASEVEGKIGNTLLKNTSSYTGLVMGVNPKGGQRNNVIFYSSIEQLPCIPDIAVIAIPAKFVIDSLRECGQKGIKRVIIISAGFKEVGNMEGEQAIVDIAQEYGIRVLGPNCLGYVDVHKNLNLSFGGKQIAKGNIAVVSQSGAMAVALMDWAIGNQVGFSKLISLGNKAVMSGNSILTLLQDDPDTDVIVVYLESIKDGRSLFELSSKITKKKPIIMVKSGLSTRGQAAASSHTGALSGANEVLKAAVDYSGIHFTSSLEELTLRGELFAKTKPDLIPDTLAIVTNAGGPGVMVTDDCELNHVTLQEFSDSEQAILKESMPDAASMSNPIDIIGDATSLTYETILNNIVKLNKKNMGILVLLTPQAVTDVDTIAHKIVQWHQAHPDYFLVVSCMGEASVSNARSILKDHGILSYDYPNKAIVGIAQLQKQKTRTTTAQETIEALTQTSNEILSDIKLRLAQETNLCSNALTATILKSFAVNFLEDKIATCVEDVSKIWSESINHKLVAKIVSKDIAHKTDCGGVIINITSEEAAINAYHTILTNVVKHHPNAEISGIMYQEMQSPSKEIFIGMKRDVNFGEVLIVGMGGIFVNVYEDVSMRLAPVSKATVRQMFESLKGFPILNGARGDIPVDLDSVVDMVFGVMSVFYALPEIKEIDINPAFANEQGSIVIDAKLYI